MFKVALPSQFQYGKHFHKWSRCNLFVNMSSYWGRLKYQAQNNKI